MRQFKLGRAGLGIAVFACAVALAAPAALAIRATHQTPANPGPGNIAKGKTIFNGYFCAACHTLKAAGPDAYGQLGVNLNKVAGGVPYRDGQGGHDERPSGGTAAVPDADGRATRRPDPIPRSTDVATFVSKIRGDLPRRVKTRSLRTAPPAG